MNNDEVFFSMSVLLALLFSSCKDYSHENKEVDDFRQQRLSQWQAQKQTYLPLVSCQG